MAVIWERISRATISGAATADVTWTTGDYDEVHVSFIGAVPVSDGVGLYARVRSGGLWDTSAEYTFAGSIIENADPPTGSTEFHTSSSSAVQITDNAGNAANDSASGKVRLFGPDQSGWKRITTEANYSLSGSTTQKSARSSGSWRVVGDVDGIRLFFDTGNISSALVHAYGIKSS